MLDIDIESVRADQELKGVSTIAGKKIENLYQEQFVDFNIMYDAV